MTTRFSEFAEQTPARGASVLPVQPSSPGIQADRPVAEEAALMNILRILNRIKPSKSPLTPIERSFVLGAKAMFEEFAKICEDLLAVPQVEEPSASPTPAASGTEQPVPASRSGTGRRASSSRPTPGGGLQ